MVIREKDAGPAARGPEGTHAACATIHVAPLDELRARGVMVVTADRPIAVFYYDGQVAAVDNRCPHLGFPLHRGTVQDGLLTCHWHEARFDLCSGCTFDLWADDAPSYETEVRDGVVFVAPSPRRPEDTAHYWRRLEQGLRHDVSLVQAKAILGLRRMGEEWTSIARRIAEFGWRNHDRWGEGMTILAIVGNLSPYLSQETMYHALVRASRQVAADCAQAVPHRGREPLDDSRQPAEQLKRWMRHWVQCRHRDGAERVLLSAIESFSPSSEFADIVYATASDRIYSQIGHVFDAANKALDLLDLIGWEFAGDVLPLTLEQMTAARGAEEDAHWHHPVEVIEPLRQVESRLPDILATDVDAGWQPDESLLDVLLGDDIPALLDCLEQALRLGASPLLLSQHVTYAAALRIARFAMTNEVADWFNPRHTFIFCNAAHQAVGRSMTPDVVRSIFHGALSVYMDRFLNVPPARVPRDKELHDLPTDADELRAHLLSGFDHHSDVEGVAGAVARYLRLGHPVAKLIDTLTFATVREDLDFHAIQVLEAGVRQSQLWSEQPQIENIFLGVARQLAAFCPTPRAAHQLATVAARLEGGDKIYENSMI